MLGFYLIRGEAATALNLSKYTISMTFYDVPSPGYLQSECIKKSCLSSVHNITENMILASFSD